jgi:hypothetical protein
MSTALQQGADAHSTHPTSTEFLNSTKENKHEAHY